jgi:hypothetical protein
VVSARVIIAEVGHRGTICCDSCSSTDRTRIECAAVMSNGTKLWTVCVVLGACLLLTAQAADMAVDRRGDDGLDSILAELKGKAMSGRMR